VSVAKARRSSPSVDRIVRGENARSLASQQRRASIEFTGTDRHPQPIRRSNEPVSHPMRDRDSSDHADSQFSRPQRSDSIRQAAGATNDRDDRGRGGEGDGGQGPTIEPFGRSHCSWRKRQFSRSPTTSSQRLVYRDGNPATTNLAKQRTSVKSHARPRRVSQR